MLRKGATVTDIKVLSSLRWLGHQESNKRLTTLAAKCSTDLAIEAKVVAQYVSVIDKGQPIGGLHSDFVDIHVGAFKLNFSFVYMNGT